MHRPLVGIPSASYEPPSTPGWPLYRYSGNYTAALALAGAAPIAIPLGLPAETLRSIFERLDGLCLAGGDDVDPALYGEERHPALGRIDAERDTAETSLARWALAADLPVLAICRGIQVLNVAAGGSLFQDLAAQRPDALRHTYSVAESPWERPTQHARVAAGSQLAGALGAGELPINSFHHQAVKETAPGFAAVAWTDDGVIEGIEKPGQRFAVGVQWHPEGMYQSDPLARQLFAAFVAACQAS